MGDNKTPRQLIRAALLEAWNADVAAVRKGDLEIIGDDLLAGLTWLFTREPLPTGTAGVTVTEAMARSAGDYLARLVYGPNFGTRPEFSAHAGWVDEGRKLLTAALAAATGMGEQSDA